MVYTANLLYSHLCVGGFFHYHRLATTILVMQSHKTVSQKLESRGNIKDMALSLGEGEGGDNTNSPENLFL